MDVWKELLCFTVDAVLFTLSYNHFKFIAKAISGIRKAEEIGVNPDPKNLTAEQKKCVIVQGNVYALSGTLPSFYSPHTKGVIQKVTITEHAISKNSTGFWSDKRHVVQDMMNSVPFALKQGNYMIQVLDSRSAYQLDLDVVATKFEPTNPGIFDGIMGFFSGIRQRGLETTEEMLKEGTLISGIGEIEKQSNGAGGGTLGPPSDGSAYFLTVMPVPSLLRKLDTERITYRWLSLLFGAGGILIGALLLKRCWFFYLRQIEEKETRKRLEEARRLRRSANRTASQEEIPEAQRCVVCRSNPREIILLPCGHICLCEDCSMNITHSCPICRSAISNKSAFFF